MAAVEPVEYQSVLPNRPQHPQGESLARAFTNNSIISGRTRSRAYDDSEEDEKAEPISSDWSMAPELRTIKQQGEKDEVKGRRLGLTWRNLTVKGVGADAAINESVGSQFNIPKIIKEGRGGSPLNTLVDNSHGCVKPGEMLLVLGRPGAGVCV